MNPLSSSGPLHVNYFQRGFDLVTSESPIHMMFTPQELEMLICGEKVGKLFPPLTLAQHFFSGIWLQRIGELHWIWWWIQSADPLCCVVRLFLFRTCFQCCGSLSKNKFLKVLGGSSLHGARRQAKIAPIYDWQVLGQCITCILKTLPQWSDPSGRSGKA